MTDINSYSPAKASRLSFIKRTKDHCAGVDRIKSAGSTYVPVPDGMSAAEFAAFVQGIDYYPVTSLVLSMFTGLVFRKDHNLKAGNSLHSIVDVITPDGQTLHELNRWAFREYVSANEGGLLVIHPRTPEGASLADVFEQDIRPFIAPFSAESVLETTYGVRGGRKVLTRVRLRESETVVLDLYLDRAGHYTMARHVDVEGDGHVVEVDQPLMNGKPMDFIPFVPLHDGAETGVLDNLAAMNQTHYSKAADKALAFKYMARPKLVVTGVKPEVVAGFSMAINSMWVLEDKDSTVEYLEFKGSGLSLPVEDLEKLENKMALMGSRMLAADDKKAAEAAETVARRQASENATLASYARHVGSRVEKALKIVAQWLGADPATVSMSLNTDFLPQPIDASLFTAILNAYDKGLVPLEDLFQIMRDGELPLSSPDYETYRARLDNQSSRHDTETLSALMSLSSGAGDED